MKRNCFAALGVSLRVLHQPVPTALLMACGFMHIKNILFIMLSHFTVSHRDDLSLRSDSDWFVDSIFQFWDFLGNFLSIPLPKV